MRTSSLIGDCSEEETASKEMPDYRIINLISFTTEIFERILNRRLVKHMNEVLRLDQFGFRKKKGIIDVIRFMCINSENAGRQ